MGEIMKKYRSRRHCLLLYPEDPLHQSALEKIKNDYNYAYILHDKDCDNDTGEVKKSHYHVIVEYPNAKWNSAVANDLGITENYIQQCGNYELALEYLIHYNDIDKYQYDIDEVHGTLKKKLQRLLKNDGKDEIERIDELLTFINESKKNISYLEFSKFCVEVGKWDVYRRSAIIFIKMIDEHNYYISEKEKKKVG